MGIPGGQGRVGSLAFAPVAAVGWMVVALLGFAVRVALFREHRTQGIVSVLWGLGFALFLWSGLRALGLHDGRAIPFAIVAWTAIALFIYLRGAALENPPVEQPGVFHRRLLALWRASRTSSFPTGPHAMKRRELAQAEAALDQGEFKTALYLLQEAERVAVAQRRLDDLLAARELVRSLSARSRGHTKAAGERLARKVTEHLNAFPSDALVSVGIRKEPERDLAGLPLIRQRLRERAGGDAIPTSRELSRARAALDDGEFAAALYLLQEARRVAVAQQKLDELLAVDELVQALVERSAGRTRTAGRRLARKVEAGLRDSAGVLGGAQFSSAAGLVGAAKEVPERLHAGTDLRREGAPEAPQTS